MLRQHVASLHYQTRKHGLYKLNRQKRRIFNRVLFHKVNLGIIPVLNLKMYLYGLQEPPNFRALNLGNLDSPIVMTHQSPTEVNDLFCPVSSPAHFKRHHATLSDTKLIN